MTEREHRSSAVTLPRPGVERTASTPSAETTIIIVDAPEVARRAEVPAPGYRRTAWKRGRLEV